MASAASQKPGCPVCNQADQVKTMQAAYDSGVQKCAPPDMPTKNVSMLSWILPSTFLVGICIVAVLVLIGSEFLGNGIFMLVLTAITLIAIVTALGLSYYAFQRVVQGDEQAQLHYPAWDRAMEAWKSLYYCSRDDVVFDPKSGKRVSNEQLASIRSFDNEIAPRQSAAVAQH
ncbi:MAG TPA: hypothetical protein VKR06_31255 [Ktedonosporobacter sp.]|nr:hypothetical protein [Ktedonosporobacter sp.]